ncbi:MAG: A/G-specific adenine glycosylase [Bacteroidota bacterium]
MKIIHTTFILWYNKHKRSLPWRLTNDPYKIWVSEIILQQTRVDQGLAYYNRFIEAFPDVFSLADAGEEQVLKCWQGLGYYSRARNMHHAAQQIVADYNGRFPDTHEEIIKLKGIGEYTAAAILSIAFNKAYPVVDGNVVRVLSRLFGIEKAYDTADGKKEILQLATSIISDDNPGTYNQAVMEFGALCCTPQKPGCSDCVFKKKCKALATGTPENFPVKMVKTTVTERHYLYFVITSGSGNLKKICLRKRTTAGILKNLYDFPCIESLIPLYFNNISTHPEFQSLFGKTAVTSGKLSTEYLHKLSHISMHVRFVQIHLPKKLQKENLVWVAYNEIKQYPVPRLIEKYLAAASIL